MSCVLNGTAFGRHLEEACREPVALGIDGELTAAPKECRRPERNCTSRLKSADLQRVIGGVTVRHDRTPPNGPSQAHFHRRLPGDHSNVSGHRRQEGATSRCGDAGHLIRRMSGRCGDLSVPASRAEL